MDLGAPEHNRGGIHVLHVLYVHASMYIRTRHVSIYDIRMYYTYVHNMYLNTYT